MSNNWLCDRCHFYEDEECTNSWGCNSDFRSSLADKKKRDVKVTSPEIDLLASYLALHPKRKIKVYTAGTH